MNMVDFSGRPFHFIGIGGIGMSALAYILAKRQLPVSGSDLRSSHITERLQSVGAYIFNRQEATNLELFQIPEQNGKGKGGKNTVTPLFGNSKASVPLYDGKLEAILPQVICSTAIGQSNSEYQAAKNKGCPIFHRSDVLAALIKEYQSIAVAGTHGKTTTSSLMGYILLEAGLDPTVIIGGEVDAIGGNARLGEGNYLVAEADESDGSLIKHCAKYGIITNIELDHPDHYQNLEEVVEIFQIFANQCEILVGCLDCATVNHYFKPTLTYSLDPEKAANYTVKHITDHAQGSTAEVWENGKKLGLIQLNVPGEHNISNALATIAIARHIGLEFEVIAQAIAKFAGAKRRFEHKGDCNGVTFIDDYAHHPSEIQATLSAARQKLRNNQFKRVVAVFQPHRYSRTTTFLAEFAQSFTDADVVIVTDIYSAGETNSQQMTGQQVAQAIARHQLSVLYQPSLEELPDYLSNILRPGDLTLFLGAGNLNQKIADVMEAYQVKSDLLLTKTG